MGEKPFDKKHKIFLYAIINENIDSSKSLSKELMRIKNKVAETLNSDRIVLQDIS